MRDESRRFSRPHRAQLEHWLVRLKEDLHTEATAAAFVEAWLRFASETRGPPSPLSWPPTEVLLRSELQAVTDILVSTTREHITVPPRETPPHRHSAARRLWMFLRRPIGRKEGLKAGGTLLDSLEKLFEAAPAWFKALLTIAKEAVDTVVG